jgi:hypothetical protein
VQEKPVLEVRIVENLTTRTLIAGAVTGPGRVVPLSSLASAIRDARPDLFEKWMALVAELGPVFIEIVLGGVPVGSPVRKDYPVNRN